MRNLPSAFAVVFAFTAPAMAQSAQDPIGSVVGGVANVAGGMLGNSPTSNATTGRRGGTRAPAGIPGLPGVPNPLGRNAPRQVLRMAADGYMNLPLETFLTTRSLRPPPFDWNSNGCRFGEITGPYRDSFGRACHRHDFGYRNYGFGGLALETTEARRTRIDDRLRDDLNGICRSDHGGLQETPCVAAAQVLYATARATGQSWFFHNTPPPPSIPTPGIPGFHNGTNNGPLPGIPMPGAGGGGGNGLPIPGLGGGGGNGLPIPGVGGGSNPAQVLTAPAQVLTGGH